MKLTEKKVKVKVRSLSPVQLFVTPWNSSLPGSSLHGILQARVLEWVAISFSRGSSRPRDRTRVSALQANALTSEPRNFKEHSFGNILNNGSLTSNSQVTTQKDNS